MEVITYTPHPESPNTEAILKPLEPGYPGPGVDSPSTLFHQRALIVSGFSTGYVARKLEQASYDRFGKNAGVGKKGFEWVLAGGQDSGR